MASLKEVKTRINSVKSTRKITSAMKMVASAKLHKAQTIVANMVPYQHKLNHLLMQVLNADLPVSSPFKQIRPVKRVALVAFSSNTSLCGAFNANVIKQCMQLLEEYHSLGEGNVLVFPVGKKVEEAVKRMGVQPQATDVSLSDKPTYDKAAELAHQLMAMYNSGEIDRVVLIYHHFKSMGTQVLQCETYLPIDLSQAVKPALGMSEEKNTAMKAEETNAISVKESVAVDYIIEPSPEELIRQLIPTVLAQQLFTVAIDSNTSEHAARTLAMQVATDNANELIQDLTKQYNKSRQQAITNELLDIVGGATSHA